MSKKKVGRKSLYDENFHPDDFIKQSRSGKTFAQIAANWNIARDTLWDWGKRHKEFSDAIKKGRELAEAWYMNLGQSALVNSVTIDGKKVKVELGWFVWMTKNMFKWQEKVLVESVNQDDDKKEDRFKHLSDEEMTEIAKKVFKKKKK